MNKNSEHLSKSTFRSAFEMQSIVSVNEKNIILDIEFPSDVIHNTNEVRGSLRQKMVKENFSQKFENNVLLCITEILTNIARHAPDKGSKIRCCIYEEYDGRLILNVFDNGTPFDSFVEERRQSIDRLNSDELYQEGFGLGLISTLFPDHDYKAAGKSSDSKGFNTFVIDLDTNASLIKKPLVYIVDDDPSLCDLIQTLLSKKYETVCFSSAKDCLNLIEEQKPDVIISDLHMPEMDGIGFRKKLDTLPGCATIPFVFLSGNKEAAGEAYVNRLGIDDYLFKPVRKDLLMQTLERLITRSRQLTHGIQDNVGKDITFLLKPTLPEKIGNWSAAVMNHMAGHGGGDFVVHRQIQDGNLVVIADVMGKGVQAKFFACAYAGYLRSFFQWMPDMEQSPGKLMNAFSDYVAKDDLFQDVLVTCQIVLLKNDGTVSIVSAGHPLPHVMRADRIEQVQVYGPLPGLLGQSEYKTYETKLEFGEKILLNTDGLIECTDLSSSILSRIEMNEQIPVQKKAELIWDVLHEIESQTKPDDQTLVVLEYESN